MDIKYEEKAVVKKVITLELDEQEALILQKVVGNIGGNHDWRKVTSGIYSGIREVLGYDKCEMFNDIHCQDVERNMYLKDKDHPSVMGQCNA